MMHPKILFIVPMSLLCLSGLACSHSHHKSDRGDDRTVYAEPEREVYVDERGREIRDPVELRRVRYYDEPEQIVVRDNDYYYRGQPVRDPEEIRAMRLAQIHAQNRAVKQKREELDRGEKQKREELDRGEKQKREELDRAEKQKREEADRAQKQKEEVAAKQAHDARVERDQQIQQRDAKAESANAARDREIKAQEAKAKAEADAREAESRRQLQLQQQDAQSQPPAR